MMNASICLQIRINFVQKPLFIDIKQIYCVQILNNNASTGFHSNGIHTQIKRRCVANPRLTLHFVAESKQNFDKVLHFFAPDQLSPTKTNGHTAHIFQCMRNIMPTPFSCCVCRQLAILAMDLLNSIPNRDVRMRQIIEKSRQKKSTKIKVPSNETERSIFR